MDTQRINEIARNAIKGTLIITAVGLVNELTKDVTVGGRKIVLFTAKK